MSVAQTSVRSPGSVSMTCLKKHEFVLGTGLQNLRECILWTQTKHDFEPKKKRPFWKQMSKNFVERYVYLIVFSTYVKTFFPRG
jgi:hypothetical protein